MPRRRRTLLIALALLAYLFLVGNRSNCDTRTPSIACSDFDVTVLPGTCAEITNPCGATDWERTDGFRLCDEPNGLFVNTQRQRSGTTRQLCASATIGTLVDVPVDYIYVLPGSFGEAVINVSTSALEVDATASPGTIDPGDPSQLEAIVSGGTPPYTFSWVPTPSLSDPSLQDPVAIPNFTTTYTVTVTDFNALTASDSVTVMVDGSLTVTATPSTISVGGTSRLDASVSGGTAPFTYRWVPGGSLDDPTRAFPFASPVGTTTYLVTVTDGNFDTMQAEVTVTVLMELVSISAVPSTVSAGDTSTLNVVVQGGLMAGPYRYLWSPSTSLDFDDIQSPTAQPSVTTTYTVVVTDQDLPPQSVSDTVTVTVNPATGPPTACFTPPSGTLAEGGVLLDASCSTPGGASIVEWRWWSPWLGDPTFPPTFVSNTLPTFLIGAEGGISFDVRLEVEDAIGLTDDVINSYVVP